MRGFVESGDNTTFSMNFSGMERLILQTIMYDYICEQLNKGEISFDDSKTLEKLSNKFNPKLFLGFIGDKFKDIKADLTVDEIRKLFLITMEGYNKYKDKNYILTEEVENLKQEINMEIKLIEKKKELYEQTKDYMEVMKLNQKFLKTMKNNSVYFFKDKNIDN